MSLCLSLVDSGLLSLLYLSQGLCCGLSFTLLHHPLSPTEVVLSTSEVAPVWMEGAVDTITEILASSAALRSTMSW